MFRGIYIIIFLIGSSAFSQTKKELMDKVVKQEKSIDSLTKVLANLENIVENRDRTAKFHVDDINKLKKEKEGLSSEISAKNRELKQLKKEMAFGESKMIQMSNRRSGFLVPEGKYWEINSFIGDYFSELSTDSTGNTKATEIHVFIKALNGEVLTNVDAGKYGPKLFSSLQPNHSLNLPIVFTEKTSFSIIILQGEMGSLKAYDLPVFCSLRELTNY